jgi:hypothetical protein
MMIPLCPAIAVGGGDDGVGGGGSGGGGYVSYGSLDLRCGGEYYSPGKK